MVPLNITGFEGLYNITDEGEVYSLRSKKFLRKLENTDGYLEVVLCNKGKRFRTGIHRLVALTFLENPQRLPMVNHKDEDKQNNHKDNLEWCDNEYNVIYSHGKVYTFRDPEGALHKVLGLNKFCRENNLQQSHMCNVAHGKLKQHKGWTLE